MFSCAEKWLLRLLTFAVVFFSVVASRIWADPVDNAVRWLSAAGYLQAADYEHTFTLIAVAAICLLSLLLVMVLEAAARFIFHCLVEFFG